MKKKVLVMVGGGQQSFDLWETHFVRPGLDREADAARAVAGEIEWWTLLKPLEAGPFPVHVGAFGGAMREGNEITTYKERATALLIEHKGIGGVSASMVDGQLVATGRTNVVPFTISGTALEGTRVLRVAWACAAQPLVLGTHDRLPAETCRFELGPSKPTSTIVFFYALWVG